MAHTSQSYVPTTDKLLNVVKACMPAPQVEPAGIEAKLLLNKVKARGVHPSEQEFKSALSKLQSNGVARSSTRKVNNKRVEFWLLSR